MDFEIISKLAYRESQMPNNATNLELLIYYMLKDLYNKHYQGKISDEMGKNEKNKIQAFYVEQLKQENFYHQLMKELSENIKIAEDDVRKITKMLNNNDTSDDILKIALDCISKLVNDRTLKKL